MRYAIVSDLHANLRAWNAVLADLCAQGADVVICLGDIVGYGPNPSEVLQGVRSVTNNFVMGNHDAAAVGMMDYSIFNDHARQAIEWTMKVLNDEQKQFLSSVPLAIEAGEILFVHAEIAEPGRFDYISNTEIAKENFAVANHLVTFVGHTHLPKIFERDQQGEVREMMVNDAVLDGSKRYIINVGSVGEPRDPDDLRARYVLYDPEKREVVFRRVEFDIVSYRNDLEATTLALRPFFLRVYEQTVEGRDVTVSNGGSLVDMKVSRRSSSLVDLEQVSKVAGLSSKGKMLQSAQASRAPMVILIAAAIIVLGCLAFWILPGRDSKAETPPVAEAEKPAAKPKPKAAPRKPEPPKPKDPEPVRVVENKPDPEPKPKPKPKPMPKPEPVPDPEPIPVLPAGTVELAWWRMGEDRSETALVDEGKTVTLIPVAAGRTIKALAPDPVPANQVANNGAKQLGIWKEQKPANHFALTADHSFTFEGWFFVSSFRKPAFLFGTRSDLEDGRGWHVDIRPRSRNQRGESIAFFYNSGTRQTEALAGNLKLANAAAHHFAIVWDHDAEATAGEMRVFLDGNQVATASLPHAHLANEQFNPFQIGAPFNTGKLGLDEVRFTRKSLDPHEFLVRAAVIGATLVKADGRSTDSWSDTSNWEGGKLPSGSDNVIISEGKKVQIKSNKPLKFSGQLVLKRGSSLHLWSKQSEEVIPQDDARLIMFADSQLVLRSKETTYLGRIELIERAYIHGGISTSGHRTTRNFAGEISGPGQLVIKGINGNIIRFDAASSFTGGMVTSDQPASNHAFHIICATDGCMGKGPVEIRENASLKIEKGNKDTIADETDLILIGTKGNLDKKLILESNETVSRLVINGEDQGEGVFTSKTHPETIGGNGKLTVKMAR
jgi:predicted phosphodiesterase